MHIILCNLLRNKYNNDCCEVERYNELLDTSAYFGGVEFFHKYVISGLLNTKRALVF